MTPPRDYKLKRPLMVEVVDKDGNPATVSIPFAVTRAAVISGELDRMIQEAVVDLEATS